VLKGDDNDDGGDDDDDDDNNNNNNNNTKTETEIRETVQKGRNMTKINVNKK
jgi:hypothetical protein